MIVLRVELENLKSHARASFDFMPGTNAIVGPNGAGKSTILEAIGWVLFDFLAYSKDNFLRKGATVGQARVTFESSLDERPYTVVRNTKNTYHVFDPATKTRVAEQKADVLAWLRQHLGLEPTANLSEFFQSAIGVPQGLFTAIFQEPATRRKAVFDKILKVEEYREAWDELRHTAQHLQASIVEADKALAGLEGRLLRLPDLEAQCAQLEAELASGRARLDATRGELARWRVRLDEFAALAAALEADQRGLQDLATRLEFLAPQAAAAAERHREAREAHELAAALAANVAAYQATEVQLGELKAEMGVRDGLREARAIAQRQLDEARFGLHNVTAQLETLARDAAELERLGPAIDQQTALEAELKALDARLTELDAAAERLKRTQAEHAQWAERQKALEAQLAELAPLAGADAQARELEARCDRLQKAVSANQEAELAYREWLGRRQRAEEAASAQRQALAELEQAIADKEPLLEKAAGLADVEAQGQEVRARIAVLEAEIERMQLASSQFHGNRCPLLDADCPVLDGRSPQDYYRARLEEANAKLKTLVAERDALRARWKEASDAHKQLAALETLRPQAAQARTLLERREVELAEVIRQSADLPARHAEPAVLGAELEAARQAWNAAQAEAARYRQQPALASQHAAIAAEQAERAARLEADQAACATRTERQADKQQVERQLRDLADPRAKAAALERALSGRLALEADQASLMAAGAQAEARLTELDQALGVHADLDARWSDAEARRAAAEPAYRRHLALVPLVEALEGRAQAAEAAERELAEARAAHETLRQQHAERRARYQIEAHEALQGQIETLKAEAIRLEQGVGFVEQRLASTHQEMNDLRRIQQEKAEQLAARERLVAEAGFLDFARDTLKEAGPYVTAAYLANVSLEADRLYREITGHAHVHLRWGAEYEILLEEQGRDRSFNNLSGGEQMAAALAVRLALLKEVSAVDVAFFDEPTTNMDEARRSNLAVQIGRIRSFKQLFVISHDDTFEQWTDHVVRVEGSPAAHSF